MKVYILARDSFAPGKGSRTEILGVYLNKGLLEERLTTTKDFIARPPTEVLTIANGFSHRDALDGNLYVYYWTDHETKG